MRRNFSQGLSLFIITLLTVWFINLSYICYGVNSIKEEAESYRTKGYEAQKAGNIDPAISWYQKAAELDQNYAAPHNDLGILFEAKGWLDRAETEYQKALSIDPNYQKAHTNLALLYERKGELEKAAFHWMRRYKLGSPTDAWTNEARQRLEKLGLLDKGEEKRYEPDLTHEIEKPTAGPGAGKPEEKTETGWTKLESLSKKEVTKEPEKPKPKEQKEVKKEPVKEPMPEVKQKEVKKEPVKEPMPEVKQKEVKKPEPVAVVKAGSAKEEGPSKEKVTKKTPTSAWTALKFTSKDKTAPASTAPRDADLEKELQESLRLAEERLKEEKGAKGTTQPKKSSGEGKPVATRSKVPTSDLGLGSKTHYNKAKDYFEKGEYARALDTIRLAKKDYPADASLSELEQSIKDKMKEERIEDHYNEAIMLYRQNDFVGARKEFEAILNILPE
jgi:Flp pilus assembly protein TadD